MMMEDLHFFLSPHFPSRTTLVFLIILFFSADFLFQTSYCSYCSHFLVFSLTYLEVQNPGLDAVLQVTLHQHSARQKKYLLCLIAHAIPVTLPKIKVVFPLQC